MIPSICLWMLCAGVVFAELPILGPVVVLEETDDVKAVANFAANEINRANRLDGRKWYSLSAITQPNLQSVIGRIYRMNLILRESNCLNNEENIDSTIDECPASSGGHIKRCSIDVWHEAWTFGYQMRMHDCLYIPESVLEDEKSTA